MTRKGVFHNSGVYDDGDPLSPLDLPADSGLSAHLGDTTDAHDASAISFSPVGTIASTDVQAAIAEVASEAVGGTLPDPSLVADGRWLRTSSGAAVWVTATTADLPDSSNKRYVTDAELTAIAALGTASSHAASDFDAAGAAASAQAASQPLDNDLTAIAGLDSSTSGSIASDGVGWIKKTYAQFKTALSLVKSDVGLSNVDNTSDSSKPVSTAQQAAIDAKVDANAGITGATKTKLTYDSKGLITSGADATTADIADSSNKRYVTDAELIVIGDTSGTNTGDQSSVVGNAGTATVLQTARSIDGQSFNGSADITVVAPGTHAATGKTTPVDADEIPLVDSAASNVLKKLTWANLKATIKAYTDTLYPSGSGTSSGTNTGDQTVPAFATNAIALGAAAAAGAASTVMRSNDTIAAFDATAPTTQAFGDAAAVGVAAVAARRDHKHAMPALTVARSAGTSASGTATTQVAALTAAASTQFVGWTITASQANATGTQFKIIITYSDTTTDTDTSVAATASSDFVNAGGIERIVAGVHTAQVALQAKAVTGLRVETAGTGTGVRAAVISAIQVPL